MKSIIILLPIFILISCVAPSNESRRPGLAGSNDVQTDREVSDGNGDSAAPTDDDLDNENSESFGTVELIQIVDPNTSTFRKKISIPKDFEGKLYLSGLNIPELKKRVSFVRFKFGRDKTIIDVDAVIGRVPGGLAPLSNLDVVILDLDNRPFDRLRLIYDLFDYNDYDEDGSSPLDPTNDPTNPGLYCRGLNLEDDPTFEGSTTNTACDQAGETCYYAYAKVTDATFKTQPQAGLFVGTVPTLYQIDELKNGFAVSDDAKDILRCLPDDANGLHLNTMVDENFTVSSSRVVPYSQFTYNSTAYFFESPYETISEDSWQISGAATIGVGGLFKDSLLTNDPTFGIKSYLFPRAAKMNFGTAGVNYFGSDDPFDSRTPQVLTSAGDTKWMDGCNYRVKRYNQDAGEGINSCNVTATIEVISLTSEGREEVLATSRDVKIQVIQEGVGESLGRDFNAMENCSDNASCGTGSCCFNSKCWSRDLVGQCVDDIGSSGNLGTGQSCSSDLECASLCCNQITGVCRDHSTGSDVQAFCSKVPGQSCVTREFCARECKSVCWIQKVIKNGVNTCEKRCGYTQVFGDCEDGVCKPADDLPDPAFDASNPDCSNASDGVPFGFSLQC